LVEVPVKNRKEESSMSKQIIQFPHSETRKCECCGAQDVFMTYENETFNYQTEDDGVVQLVARVPVWTCGGCEEQSTDERAEDIRHETVCEFLGRLAPAKIKEIRKRIGMSQNQFAELTGFGIASIKRWESGALIQGLAQDRYMRLLEDGRNVTALQRQPGTKAATKKPQFRTELSPHVVAQATLFVLRVPNSAAA
jgi:putative zinc finger/helix-turn-helix YgiT family protein